MFSVGMIGAGIIGASHLAAVAGHPDTRLAAVADIARSRRPHPTARTLMKAMKKCWSGKSWSL